MTPSAALPTASTPRLAGLPPAAPVRPAADLKLLRRLLWLYLALWISEGALRKWIFPGLATPLLVVRDPVLLLMYALAMQKGVFPRSLFIPWIAGLSFLALAFSLIGSRAPLLVQIYGYRADFLHLPLVFLIPNLFDREDVQRVGKWTLLVALPMAFLVLLQFRSPVGARVNVGVGGEGTMLDAGFGHIRASGTFSFTNGLTNFTAIVSAFAVYGLLTPRAFPRLLRWAALPALAMLILLSASRGVVGMVTVVLAAMLVVGLFQPRYLAPTVKIIGVLLLGALVAGSVAVFQDGLEVFAYRFGSATNVREGFVGRFFDSFLVPFRLFDRVDFYGVGLGMGTNVGAGLLFEGERKFLFAESEMGRVMFESGSVVGPAFLLLRLSMMLFLFGKALGTLRRDGHPLAMLIFGSCAVDMMLGQFGQATTLGFVTIAAGLCLAANRSGIIAGATTAPASGPARLARPLPPLPPTPRPAALPGAGSSVAANPSMRPAADARVARGRSLYAEQLHRAAEEKNHAADDGSQDAGQETKPPA